MHCNTGISAAESAPAGQAAGSSHGGGGGPEDGVSKRNKQPTCRSCCSKLLITPSPFRADREPDGTILEGLNRQQFSQSESACLTGDRNKTQVVLIRFRPPIRSGTQSRQLWSSEPLTLFHSFLNDRTPTLRTMLRLWNAALTVNRLKPIHSQLTRHSHHVIHSSTD